jgi:predicted transcriptional regulator
MAIGDMGSALEAIRFFANSANRVRVFDALTDGPKRSRTLIEQTNTSRSTVARVLNEGESRGWIDSTGSLYELTYMGTVMIDEFRAYLRTVEGAQQLGEAINYLPEPMQGLDVRHICEAEITTPTKDSPQAYLNRALQLYREGETYRGLTQIAPEIVIKTLADLADRDRLHVEGVIEAEFIEGILDDPERAAPWHSFANQVWVYDGHIPLNMHLIDDTVVVWLVSTDGDTWDVYGLMECDNPAVMTWAESLYQEYRTAAEPLDPASLA